jgi:enamine deaminase RidA (YjgF/YER057c/UK114 family)
MRKRRRGLALSIVSPPSRRKSARSIGFKQVIAVHGLVNSTLDCTDQAAAMNGASDFVVAIFGDAGRHVRTAAGVASLPMGFAASVYMIVEV